MKNLIIILISVALCSSITAQDAAPKNYITTSVSYSFFGTGDLSGTAIGLTYTHMLSNSLGFQLGYSKASGHGNGIIFEDQKDKITNFEVEGTGSHAFESGLYNSFNLGAAYKIADGNKHVLLSSVGLNYKTIKYGYPSGLLSSTLPDGNREYTVTDLYFYTGTELGFYVSLDYMIFFKDDLAFGIHGSLENTSNVLSNAGLSISYRL